MVPCSAIGLRYPFSGSYRSVRVKNGALIPPKLGWGNQTYYVIKEDTDFDPPSVSEDLIVRSDFTPSNSVSSLPEPGTDVKKEFMDTSSGLQGTKLYIYQQAAILLPTTERKLASNVTC